MTETTKSLSRSQASPRTFVHAFLVRVRESPAAVFVADPFGIALTYTEALARASAIRNRLRDVGIGSGDRVGLYLPNTPSWPVASLGVWSLGASVVACGTLLAPEEAERAFELSSVAAILTTEAEAFAGLAHEILAIDDRGLLTDEPSALETPNGCVLPEPESEAVVFFTSGTTGTPKGVPHKHADLMQWAEQVASAYAGTAEFRATTAPESAAPGVIFTPFGHIGGYLALAFRVWIGRLAVLVPKFSTEVVSRLLDRYEFQALQLTPTMVHMLANAEEELPMGRLEYVTSSTAPLTTATREAFETRYGIPVIQAYGMTEVGTISQERYSDVRAGLRPANSVGRPAVGVEVRILGEDGAELSLDAEGEIVVRTATAAPSYLGQHGPPSDGDWFHTGDVGRLDADGFLYITGRRSDRIIVGGFNVYPAEVEGVLLGSELVVDAAVVGVSDDRLGERPVAIVVWSGEPKPDALREEARERMAHYKVPREWLSVVEVPLTNRGKVDRLRVRELIEERRA